MRCAVTRVFPDRFLRRIEQGALEAQHALPPSALYGRIPGTEQPSGPFRRATLDAPSHAIGDQAEAVQGSAFVLSPNLSGAGARIRAIGGDDRIPRERSSRHS
jgi:hypothetical protein